MSRWESDPCHARESRNPIETKCQRRSPKIHPIVNGELFRQVYDQEACCCCCYRAPGHFIQNAFECSELQVPSSKFQVPTVTTTKHISAIEYQSQDIKMNKSIVSYVLAFVAMCSVVQAGGGAYTYNPGSKNCAGTSADKCGPEYWYKLANSGSCKNVDGVSIQTPVDFSNVEEDTELKSPEFHVEDGGCDVSSSSTLWRDIMYLY
jgi:hypothetical protein